MTPDYGIDATGTFLGNEALERGYVVETVVF